MSSKGSSSPTPIPIGGSDPDDVRAVTLPAMVDDFVARLEGSEEVEAAFLELLRMVGTLLELSTVAVFSCVEDGYGQGGSRPMLAFEVATGSPVHAAAPGELLARIRLGGRRLLSLGTGADDVASTRAVFRMGKDLPWGRVLAIEQHGRLEGLLAVTAERAPKTKSSLDPWLTSVSESLGWCLPALRIARELHVPGLLRALGESVEGVSITDAEGRVQSVDAGFLIHAGRPRHEVVGLSLAQIFFRNAGGPRLGGQTPGASVSRVVVRSALEEGRTLDLRLMPVPDATGAPRHRLAVLTEHKPEVASPAAGELGYLRSLPSRSVFLDRLQVSLNRTRRQPDHQVAVVSLDVDRFSTVVGSLGHALSNELLTRIGERLVGAVRATDTVAWLGADEFAMLVDGIRDPTDGVRVCRTVQLRMHQPFQVGESELYASLTMGVAAGGADYRDARELLGDADTAMQRAKRKRAGSFRVFDRAMHRDAVRRLDIETNLRRSIDKGALVVHFQPIVEMSSGRTVAYEALARWKHGGRLLPPGEFIGIAEDMGLVGQLGAWVLHEACRIVEALPGGDDAPAVTVNVSPSQLESVAIVEHVLNALRASGLTARRLKLEITETSLMDNVPKKIELLARLRDHGVGCVIDDFGTGYSSLSLLTRLPVDVLKIDKSFVARMGESGPDAKVVRAVIDLAHSLGLAVTAEGIETEEQRAALDALACDMGQGFLFGAPRPLVEEEGQGAK